MVGVLRSSNKTQRGERADDEYSYPKPERPRRRGVPVRLDGRDDGRNARLRQTEPAVPPVFRSEVHCCDAKAKLVPRAVTFVSRTRT